MYTVRRSTSICFFLRNCHVSLWRVKEERDIQTTDCDIVDASPITKGDLAGLPEPVHRYLEIVGVIGRPRIQTVFLRQCGRFRTSPNGPWGNLRAEQRYTVQPPSFVWRATIATSSLLPIRVVDGFWDGHGTLQAKLWGVLSVARAAGPEVDSGELLRFLSEFVWFPTAWLSPYVTWSERDEASAEATISWAGTTASVTLVFDQDGRINHLEAMRYRLVGRTYSLDRWTTPVSGYAVVNDLLVPLKGKAIFRLTTGDFEYFDGEVTQLEYDQPATSRA